jgi:hypothetical protein
MAVVNSGLALLLAFGLNMTDTQQGSVQAFVNALLVMVAAVAHSNAKRTKTVIPAPPLDESQNGPSIPAQPPQTTERQVPPPQVP